MTIIKLVTEKRFCYWVPSSGFVPGQGMRLSIVKEGEQGHYPTGTWPCTPKDKAPYFSGDKIDPVKAALHAELRAAQMNEDMGLSEDDVQEILMSSLFKKG